MAKNQNTDRLPRSQLPKLQKKPAEEFADEREKYYPIRLKTLDERQTISFTPISAVVGGLFLLSIYEVADKFKLYAENIVGLGPANTAFAKVTQLWQFQPEPSQDTMEKLMKELEIIHRLRLDEHLPKKLK
jgi:hypothetical protein